MWLEESRTSSCNIKMYMCRPLKGRFCCEILFGLQTEKDGEFGKICSCKNGRKFLISATLNTSKQEILLKVTFPEIVHHLKYNVKRNSLNIADIKCRYVDTDNNEFHPNMRGFCRLFPFYLLCLLCFFHGRDKE